MGAPTGRSSSSSLSDKVRSPRLTLFLDEEDCNSSRDDAACCVSLVRFVTATATNESSSHCVIAGIVMCGERAADNLEKDRRCVST